MGRHGMVSLEKAGKVGHPAAIAALKKECPAPSGSDPGHCNEKTGTAIINEVKQEKLLGTFRWP